MLLLFVNSVLACFFALYMLPGLERNQILIPSCSSTKSIGDQNFADGAKLNETVLEKIAQILFPMGID